MMVACDHHAHAPAYCVHVGDVASHPHEPCVDDCTGEWSVWLIRQLVYQTCCPHHWAHSISTSSSTHQAAFRAINTNWSGNALITPAGSKSTMRNCIRGWLGLKMLLL